MTFESKEQELIENSDSSISTSSTITSSHPSALSLQALGDSDATLQSAMKQSASTDDEKMTTNKSRHVSFDSVHIHEHPVILGCNPGVRALPSGPGPALTLSWDSLRSSDYNMEEFEAQRQLTRRPKQSLRTTKSERIQFLMEEGFTSEELKMAEEAIRHIHESREASAQEKSELSALLRESKKRQEEKRQKKGNSFVRKIFGVFKAKT
ncbi:hypothetical protein FisN_5Hu510 [Fistulifera solaris]|uniref:Uncharacterized protein n=1 Tax=Fistulifera solaris TaxID=1519565 RepID=A0A1Z5JSX5_FISSO|nr:hypothetical protein FisN_5Hu510 [Fistulifera solaris]|eukprot:GAX17124.1 hypothetical protein FisN_5Hu510 [Fistulifera solaris]